MMIKLNNFAWATGLLLATASGMAADLTSEQVRAALLQASVEKPADFSRKNLSNLDLDGLDFKAANLSGANLFGAKLVGADLRKANLTGATLDAAWLMRANFSGAVLANASLFAPVVYSTLAVAAADRPTFVGANLTGARVIARFAQVDLSHANFSKARMGVDLKNQPMGQMRSDFSGAILTGANFSGADVNRALFSFANLAGANFTGANLFGADLAGADLTDANLTGADLTQADLDGTILKGAQGLDTVKGMDQATHRESAIYR
jgi:uncharacterized protein YjbI with pentapeptide repeats